MSRSNSSSRLSLLERADYLWRLFRMSYSGRQAPGTPFDTTAFDRDFDELDAVCRKYTGRGLAGTKALEIGFGARPQRLFWFAARGADVAGVDLDSPVLNGTPAEFWRVLRTNGPLRFTKTLLRYWLFDRTRNKSFKAALEKKGATHVLREDRLIVSDAAKQPAWDRIGNDVKLIYSYRVFEHIPREQFSDLMALCSRQMQPDALLVAIVTIYPGLTGNHLPEWYPHLVKQHGVVRKSEPWEHLRKLRFRADTYLNELSRRDYTALFSRYFDVVEDDEVEPGLGREFLTEDVRRELSQYDEYELLSNDVRFVLRPRSSPSH